MNRRPIGAWIRVAERVNLDRGGNDDDNLPENGQNNGRDGDADAELDELEANEDSAGVGAGAQPGASGERGDE